MVYLWLFVILAVVPLTFQSKAPTGAIELDEVSFDKVVKKFEVVLVKFDVAFPYGDKHDAFVELGKDAQDFDELLIAQVGVKDYGEKDNEALARKYGATKENFPTVKLFVKGQPEPVTFDEKEFTTDSLRRFVRKHSSIHLSLPGCVRKLDELVGKFLDAPGPKRKEILKSSDKIALAEKDTASAKIYKTIMEKILEKGDDFINTENERVKKLLAGKLSDEKKKELSIRLNILQTFQYTLNEENKQSKNEL